MFIPALISFGDFLKTAEGVMSLIVSLVSLVSAGIGAFFAIKSTIEKNKGKSFAQIWKLLMEIADSAMKEAEASSKAGAEKKELAINIVNAAAKAAGIDITPFTEQLSDYIDQAIKFANDISKK